MINSCLIIGCGGTGQFLVPAATKLLQYHPAGTLDITICDGDDYTYSNNSRQYVSKVGDNKALALAKTLPSFVKVIPNYINNTNVFKILNELVSPALVIPCVDNLATRHILLKNLDRLDLEYYWICPGNEQETYQVSFYQEGLFSHPFDRYRNLAYPLDNVPGGCLEETPSTPQLIAANMNAAATTISILTNLLDQKPLPQEVIGTIRELKHDVVGKWKSHLLERNEDNLN